MVFRRSTGKRSRWAAFSPIFVTLAIGLVALFLAFLRGPDLGLRRAQNQAPSSLAIPLPVFPDSLRP